MLSLQYGLKSGRLTDSYSNVLSLLQKYTNISENEVVIPKSKDLTVLIADSFSLKIRMMNIYGSDRIDLLFCQLLNAFLSIVKRFFVNCEKSIQQLTN